jgi:ribosome-interacting GTPase 1
VLRLYTISTTVAKKPVPVTSEMELSVMKNKVAELKAQVNQYSTRERSSSTSGEGFNIVSDSGVMQCNTV